MAPFEPEEALASDLLTLLKNAVAGLLFISETDAPLTPFVWPGQSIGAEKLTPAILLAFLHKNSDTPVETQTVDEFFRDHVDAGDEDGLVDQATALRFQKLVVTLQEHLTDLTVYRVGSVQVSAYVVGKTGKGDFTGVQTLEVET